MQVDGVLAACDAVQPVDVLRQQQVGAARCLQLRQCVVRSAGLGMRHRGPADQAACPVASARGVVTAEGLEGNGRGAHPVAVAVAVGGDARFSATARAGQHEEPGVAGGEVGKCVGGCVHALSIRGTGIRCGGWEFKKNRPLAHAAQASPATFFIAITTHPADQDGVCSRCVWHSCSGPPSTRASYRAKWTRSTRSGMGLWFAKDCNLPVTSSLSNAPLYRPTVRCGT